MGERLLHARIRARPEMSPESDSVQSTKRPSEGTINSGPPIDAKRSHARIKDPAVLVRVRWIMETLK